MLCEVCFGATDALAFPYNFAVDALLFVGQPVAAMGVCLPHSDVALSGPSPA